MSETAEEKAAREQKEAQEKTVADLEKKVSDQEKMLEDGKKASDQLTKELKDSKNIYSDPEYVEFLDKKEKESKGSSTSEGDTDLNAMSRAEFATHIQKGMSDVLTDAAKKWDEEIDTVKKAHYKLLDMTDVELEKIRGAVDMSKSEFATLLASEEGKERFLKVADSNKEWGATKIFEDIKKDDIVKEKEKTDLEASQAEEEEKLFREKPAAALSIADKKDMSDDEITGKIYDSHFGDKEHPVEEEGGIVVPLPE